jgi:hypothetical protein
MKDAKMGKTNGRPIYYDVVADLRNEIMNRYKKQKKKVARYFGW